MIMIISALIYLFTWHYLYATTQTVK